MDAILYFRSYLVVWFVLDYINQYEMIFTSYYELEWGFCIDIMIFLVFAVLFIEGE